MPLLREDHFILHCSVTDAHGNNIPYPSTFSWTSMEGGDVSATNVNTRPGGFLPALDLGGPANRSDVTIKRQYSSALHPFMKRLEDAVGIGKIQISYTPIDGNKSPIGNTVTYTAS
jgi:hypothetical protein